MTIIDLGDNGDELAEVVEDAIDSLEEIVENNAETVEDLAEVIEDLAETVEELAETIAEEVEDNTPAVDLIAIGERLAHLENRIDQIEVSRMDEIIESAEPVDEPSDETVIVAPDETPTSWLTSLNDWWFGRSS
jgi:uncharacterized protein Yka (UPF0111/DUF47 family)